MKLFDYFNRFPDNIKQTPEFRTLLQLVREQNLSTAAQFINYLQAEISEGEGALKVLGAVSTNNRKRVELGKWLAFLKLIHEKVLVYL